METEFINKDANSSRVFGVSIRAWLAVILVITVCVSHLLIGGISAYHSIVKGDLSLVGTLTTIGEPLYSMSVAALGFYFGNQKSKTS